MNKVLTGEEKSVEGFFDALVQPENDEQHWLDVGLRTSLKKLLSQLISLNVNTEDDEQLKNGELKGVILGLAMVLQIYGKYRSEMLSQDILTSVL